MSDWRVALFEHGLDLYELTSSTVAESYIRRGILHPDSEIEIYDEDGVSTRGQADQYDQFVVLFEAVKDDDLEHDSPHDGNESDHRDQLDDIVTSDLDVFETGADAERDSDAEAGEAESQAEGAAGRQAKIGGGSQRRDGPILNPVHLALAVLILVAGFFLWGPRSDSKWTIRLADTYATRAASGTAEWLDRGTELKVADVEQGWAKIIDGKGQGRFIRADSLSDTPPPTFDSTGFSGPHPVRQNATIHEKPDDDAAVVTSVVPNSSVTVIGRLTEQNGAWLEVETEKGSIGYIRSSRVEGVPPSGVKLPPARPTAHATPTPGVKDACAAEQGLDWALCRNPGLYRLDNTLEREFEAARQRNPAMAGMPPGDRRRAQGHCGRKLACYRDVYSRRIAELQGIPAPAPPAPTPTATKAPPSLAAPARPRDRDGWINESDYPPQALRHQESGTTVAILTIDTDGRVLACNVSVSSGSSALDGATCRVLKRRARFYPATDAAGYPTSSIYTARIRWTLPEQ